MGKSPLKLAREAENGLEGGSTFKQKEGGSNKNQSSIPNNTTKGGKVSFNQKIASGGQADPNNWVGIGNYA